MLNSSRYGDFDPLGNRWLNVSGFGNGTGFAWEGLDRIRERVEGLKGYALRGFGEEGFENEVEIISGGAGSGGSKDGNEEGRGYGRGHGIMPLDRNVIGVVHGSWIRSPIQKEIGVPKLNVSRYAPEGPWGPVPITGFGRNLTGGEGAVKMRFQEWDEEKSLGKRGTGVGGERVDAVRLVSAQMELEGKDGLGDAWDVQLNGLHYLDTGNMLFTTTSEK